MFRKKEKKIYIILKLSYARVSVNSIDKVFDCCIRDLGSNPRLH